MLYEVALFLGVIVLLVTVIKLTVTGKAPKQAAPITSPSATADETSAPAKTKQSSKQKSKSKQKQHKPAQKKSKAKKTKPTKKQSKSVEPIRQTEGTDVLDEVEPFVMPKDPTLGKSRKNKSKNQTSENIEQVDDEFEGAITADGWNVVKRHKPKKVNKQSDPKEAKKEKKRKESPKQEEKQEPKQLDKPILTEDGEVPLPIKPIYSSAEEFWKPKPKSKPKAKPAPSAPAKPKQAKKEKKGKTQPAKRVVNPNKLEVTLTSRGWGKAPETTGVSLDGEFPSLSEAKKFKHKKDKANKQQEKESNKDLDQDGLHSQEGSDGEEEEELISVEAPEVNDESEEAEEDSESGEEDEEEDSEEDEEEEEEQLPHVMFSLKGNFNPKADVKIVGSHPQIGSWDINHAPSMILNNGSWTLSLPIDTQTFQYKYVRIEDGEEIWEGGENRSFETSDETEMEINDQWR